MPNWCHCSLILISNEKENLINFMEENKESDEIVLSFNKKISLPNNMNNDWYSWRCDNWGTKWDINDENVQMKFDTIPSDTIPSDTIPSETIPSETIPSETIPSETIPSETIKNNSLETLTYKFNTAWSPPIPWVHKISSLYYNINFTIIFGEEGDGYAGKTTFYNGIHIAYEEMTFSKYMWDYQINKAIMIRSTLEFFNNYINEIVNIVKRKMVNSIILVNKICVDKLFIPYELQIHICKFIKYNTIAAEVVRLLEKEIILENIKKYFLNYWDLDCETLINTIILPLLSEEIKNHTSIICSQH
jgi:hypothetical protein